MRNLIWLYFGVVNLQKQGKIGFAKIAGGIKLIAHGYHLKNNYNIFEKFGRQENKDCSKAAERGSTWKSADVWI